MRSDGQDPPGLAALMLIDIQMGFGVGHWNHWAGSGRCRTSLERDLREQGIDTLIIAGIQSDQCVSSTVRMAGNLGFVTLVVADACATFDRAGFDGRHFAADVIHDTSLASLHREFATVVTARDFARQWRSCAAL